MDQSDLLNPWAGIGTLTYSLYFSRNFDKAFPEILILQQERNGYSFVPNCKGRSNCKILGKKPSSSFNY